MWMVRAGAQGRAYSVFLNNGVIAIGTCGDGDLLAGSHETILRHLVQEFPEARIQTLSIYAREDIEFRDHMKIGQNCLTYSPAQRSYLVGIIRSEAFFDPHLMRTEKPWGLVRQVDWHSRVPRDALLQSTQSQLSFRHTLKSLNSNFADDILQKAVIL